MPQPDFARMLRRFRHAAGWSQEELASEAGISGDAVAALERGRRRAPRPLTVRLLAEALGLSGDQRAAFIGAARQQGRPSTPPVRQTPVAADEFIGRSTDLAEVVQLLTESHVRMVTLTGPGGVGKTRLAIEIANTIGQRPDASVNWAPLGPTADQPTVAAAVAAAVGVQLPSNRPPLDVLTEHLAGEQRLLLLDNCEHVIDAAADLSDALLRTCPALRIVATSRELLRVQGEMVRPVQPLAPADAVRMFVIRAIAHGVRPDRDDVEHVRRICRRLDGIPLAIELAAARVNVLTVEQIAEELETSFQILNTGARTAPERQQSLHAAVDWSYQLLTVDEQRFFAALSVFAGGWTIPAAQALGPGMGDDDVRPGRLRSDDRPDSQAETIDLTGRLADKSLIMVRRDGATARYDMFDVIQAYAAERLDQAGQRDRAEFAHLRYFTRLAEEANPELHGPEHGVWLARLDTELDNFRVAMRRATQRRSPADALRLAGALCTYCYLRGHYSEGRAWLDAALRSYDRNGGRADTALRAKALRGAGYLAFLQCEYSVATEALDSARALYRELADDAGTGLTLRNLGSVARERGDYDVAEDLHRRSLQTYTSVADESGVAWARHHLGFVCWLRGNFSAAREHAEAALAAFRTVGDGEGVVWSLISLGSVALYGRDLDEAETLLRQALARARRQGFREGAAWSQNQLGIVATLRHDINQAADLLEESLAAHQELGDRWRATSVLEALATVVLQRGQPRQAAFLLGTADAVRDEIGAPVPLCEQPAHRNTVAAVTAELDPADYAASWAEGHEKPLHQP